MILESYHEALATPRHSDLPWVDNLGEHEDWDNDGGFPNIDETASFGCLRATKPGRTTLHPIQELLKPDKT